MKILKEKKYSILSAIVKYSFIFIIGFSIILPVVFAAPDGSTANVSVKTGIENPLGKGNLQDLPSFIEAIINVVLTIGVPIIVLAIIYAGFLFVKAQGNPGELEKAKKTIIYTLIGGALLLGAWVIANAIKGTVEDIKSTS